MAERLGDDSRLSCRWQHPGVGAAPDHVQERRAERQQHDDDDGGVGDRAAHHAAREPVPGTRGLVGARPGHRVPSHRAADAQRVDPGAEHGEKGRQDGQRGEHVDEHGRHAAVAHRAQEHLGEQHQAGQRDRDRDTRDRDRAAGRRHRPGQRRLGGTRPAHLLAEPADDEEPVVDGKPEPEDRGDVDRVDRHRGEQGQQPQRGERAEYGDSADRQRQAGGGQPAEDDQQQDEQDRHGQALGPADIAGDLVVDRFLGRGEASYLSGQARRRQLVRDRGEAGDPGGVAAAGEFDDGVGLLPVRAHELRRTGREVGRQRRHPAARQRGQRARHRRLEGRVAHRHGLARVEHHNVAGITAERPGCQVGLLLALASRRGEPARRLKRAEHAGAPHGEADHAQRRYREHQPAPAVDGASPCFEHPSSPLRRCLTPITTVNAVNVYGVNLPYGVSKCQGRLPEVPRGARAARREVQLWYKPRVPRAPRALGRHELRPAFSAGVIGSGRPPARKSFRPRGGCSSPRAAPPSRSARSHVRWE